MLLKVLIKSYVTLEYSALVGRVLSVLCWSFWLYSCQNNPGAPPLFKLLDSTHTTIQFRNEIVEDEEFNILNFTNLYTGSGVGIGDFNKDGFPDIYLGGCMESSRLYINQSKNQFEDQTEVSGVQTKRWVTGIAVVDINEDGWDDIYVCVSGPRTNENRANLLFVNQQDGTFLEQAQQYGIADTAQCTHAGFFDYDKDGDLDLFLAINPTDYQLHTVNTIRRKQVNGESPSTDKLYRNEGDGSFTDVSKSAGILIEGYSLGFNLSDLNQDNWPDIYITNDFLTNDILYINNQDGTFTNQASQLLKHTSFASMGVDVADINNDGYPEIYTLDMFPEDSYRQKMIMGSDNYDRFQYMLKAGYEPQYSRNNLQLNNRNGSFSEIGQYANIHKTDWSWSCLFADFDNDGWKDLVVTNGFRRDMGDLDFINYSKANPFGSPTSRKKNFLERLHQLPGAQLPNYIFKNEGGTRFSKQYDAWGLTQLSYSHGAAIADLDLDGDVDLIINNVAQEAFVYENQSESKEDANYLSIELLPKAAAQNAKITIYTGDKIQYAEYNSYRGYLSTVASRLHFGLGSTSHIDSLKVLWPSGKETTIKELEVNQQLSLQSSIVEPDTIATSRKATSPIFEELTLFKSHTHQEDLQVDFKMQALLPHQHSRQGPPLAVADINGDGLEDLFMGGAAGYSGTFFIQNQQGKFYSISLGMDEDKEDAACLFFDVDQDKDPDLYVVSGGVCYPNTPDKYLDRLYINQGGQFIKAPNQLPAITSSGSCVKAADYDGDGDLDVFVGAGVEPGRYPNIPRSFLLENQQGVLVDKTPKELQFIGMIRDALWSDYDGDQDMDLWVIGEFMPITLFRNASGKLSPMQLEDLAFTNGWWNTIAAGDFDRDGDPDYLLGNLGLNSNLKATKQKPIQVHSHDFDQNGSIDPIFTQYYENEVYPIISRDKLISQIPPIKARFSTYKKYATARFSDLFEAPEKEGMQSYNAYLLESIYLENKGDNRFTIRTLRPALQWAPIQAFHIEDINDDQNLDVLVVGNDYSTEVSQGAYDAFTGAYLQGDGKGHFEVFRGNDCGFLADKDARSLVQLYLPNNNSIYVVGNNSDTLQTFTLIR